MSLKKKKTEMTKNKNKRKNRTFKILSMLCLGQHPTSTWTAVTWAALLTTLFLEKM